MSTSQPFTDWVTVSQTHSDHEPLYGSININTDCATGEIKKTYLPKNIAGKYGSNVQITSDGTTVKFSGNPSRFNKINNVQGVSLDEAKILINEIMVENGLPKFTKGKVRYITSGKRPSLFYDGATFSRIDITQNFQLGSKSKRNQYQNWIQNQEYPRLLKSTYQRNTYFGKDSESRQLLIYDKALEISDKNRGNLQLADRLDQIGALRYEMKYQKYLRTSHKNLWHTATQERLSDQFRKDIKIMTQSIQILDIEELESNVLKTLLVYRAGIDPMKHMGRNQYYQHKKILKNHGIDISNMSHKRIRHPTITIKPEPLTIDLDQQKQA